MTGYQGDPERDADAMRGGYYHTGDVATSDDDGYITYVGRTDDVFKASDYRISPFELESRADRARGDRRGRRRPVTRPAPPRRPQGLRRCSRRARPRARNWPRTIMRFCRDRVPGYKRIRRVEFADLPKTISGKIRRVELRAQESDPRGTRGSTEFWEEDFTW